MRRLILLAILGLTPVTQRDDPVLTNPDGSQPAPIDRIEEDWQIVVQTTDIPAAGPQITTTMCPGPLEDHPDVNFNLNYREGDQFRPGGLQIEVFDGPGRLANISARSESLATDNETISWTQSLSLSNGAVQFQIKSGQSNTWGTFGGDELSVAFTSSLSDLSGYKPDISIAKSGVGWQSDHVTSMTLVQVRYYSGTTLVTTDNTPRVIHPND
jgi:hypothetical protein